MRKPCILTAIILLLSAPWLPAQEGRAWPDEASLLTAWEEGVRSDATTEVFTRTADRTYRFKTKLFPFDGELKVLNLLIQEYGGGEEEAIPGFAVGSVEVELVGFSQEQMTRYARSYGYWYQLNTLYFDHASGRWLTGREYRSAMMAKVPASGRGSFAGWLSQNYFLVIMIALALFLWWVARKSGRQVKTAMSRQDEAMEITRRSIALSEKAVQQNDETIRLLQEILLELKKKN